MNERSPEQGQTQQAALPRYYRRRVPASPQDYFVDELAAEELGQRFADLALKPQLIADLGARCGAATRAIATVCPDARIVAVECCAELLAGLVQPRGRVTSVVCDVGPIPLADSGFDMALVNLSASFWPPGLIAEALRVMRPGGALLLSAFGQRNLIELMRQLPEDGPGLRLGPGRDAMSLGSEIVRAGGAEPVVDSRTVQLEYPDLASLRRDFSQSGISYRAEAVVPAKFIDSLEWPRIVTLELLFAVAFKPG